MEIRAMLDRLATYMRGNSTRHGRWCRTRRGRRCTGNPVGDPSVEGAVLRAAPFIARAAQVQVLREMAAKFEEYDRRLMLDCPCWDKAADRVRERADELECQQ